MRRVAAGTVAISIALAGCTPTTEKPSAAPATLHQYIVDNGIIEVPFRRGDPGTPTVRFAAPPGWRNAGDRTPEWAYGAIVYDTPRNPQDPPYMTAIASKLTGHIDAAKVLEYAPGQLNELPGFEPLFAPRQDSLSGFHAMDYAGRFDWNGTTKTVGQVTIVVPGPDAVFVFQLNAVAPQGEEQVVTEAAGLVARQTRIEAP